MTNSTALATYDASAPAVVIHALSISDPSVTQEALRWGSGRRAAAAPATEVEGADLTAFVEQALVIGAQAIAVAGHGQDVLGLERIVSEVGVRTAEASAKAAELTTKSVDNARATLDKATTQTRLAIEEANTQGRKAFAETVATAQRSLSHEVTRLFGGEDPELLVRLKPLLDQFGESLTRRADENATALLDRAARALDVDDPASPMARQMRAIQASNSELTSEWSKQHAEVLDRLAELSTRLQVQSAAVEAVRRTASVTPLKGATFEDGIHSILEAVTAALGDEYARTGVTVGALASSKKGDGVITVSGQGCRVVVEMSHGHRREWGSYLDEAERNRQAVASLGVVPSPELNAGEHVRVLGPRRVVVVFDPERDDPTVLRAALQILRLAAMEASRSGDTAEISTAQEKINAALSLLTRIEAIRKDAGGIQKTAIKIDRGADALRTDLHRLLLQAQTALASTPASSSTSSGAA